MKTEFNIYEVKTVDVGTVRTIIGTPDTYEREIRISSRDANFGGALVVVLKSYNALDLVI